MAASSAKGKGPADVPTYESPWFVAVGRGRFV